MADYNLEGPVWSSKTITWSFATANFSGQPDTFSSFFRPGEYEQEIIDALKRWSAAADVTFVEVADSASADIRFGLGLFDGPGGILAETSYYYSNGNFLPDVTIDFDQAESYTSSANGLILSGGIEFEAVATHEIGHALGLDHYNDGPAIMNAYASAGVTNLTRSDIDGIQALYGPPSSQPDVPASTIVTNGTAASDVLLGSNAADAIYALGGNDYIYAYGGDDLLFGGDGTDVLLAGSGNDELYGGTGFNYLFGGDGNDTLFGSGGASSSDVNVMFGENGADLLYGGTGTNYFYGGAGVDTMFGGSGLNIFISSGETNGNVIYGGSGQNYVYGSNGGDTVFGGSGVDVFLMGSGADNIAGGGGIDYAWGGAGADTFNINDSSQEIMVVEDFNVGGLNDFVNFAGTSLHSFADVRAVSFYNAGINTTVITDAAGSAVWLIGVAPGQLDASMFQFS
ncbi:Ca2+-binding RTX toxin-like protein [Bradyrhizobium sp. i1.8.4]|uniref:matrixin family metalloprotease n=1 Tax=unclassified Bradyrhizobium TaxID=2631580 RepID=UPI003D24C974